MLIKYGSIITEGSGSLGGHTIQHSKGGMQLRTKPIPRGYPSVDQYSIRSINPVLQAGWRSLTNAQRKIWNNWPVTHGIFNANGEKHPLSGHSLWMKYQFQYIKRGAPFLSDPALMGPPYLGPEYMENGTFESSAGWTLNPQSSVHDGRLFLNSTTPALWCYIHCLWPAWTLYQIKYNCQHLTNPNVIRFGTGSGNWQGIVNGDVCIQYTSGNYTSGFYFYWFGTGSADIDNFSIKRIYL